MMEEQLQNENEEQSVENTCGGLPMPPDKKGELGYWDCQGDVWVWVYAP